MLPKIFKPEKPFKLIRLGSKNDGGYLVEEYSIKVSEILLSLGISDNWEFEKDFLKRVESVIAIDNRLDFKFLIKKFISSLLTLNIKNSYLFFLKIYEFNSLFKKSKISYLKKYVSNKNTNGNIDFSTIFNKFKIQSKDIFIKIDIEGSEYRILDEILNIQSRICGLIIEFHDTDLHYEKVENFIKKIDLNLAHIHANNFSHINKDNDPTVLEMTFTRNTVENGSVLLPNNLDSPNNPNLNEILLRFIQ